MVERIHCFHKAQAQVHSRDMLLTPKHFCLSTKHSDGFMGRLLDSAPHVGLASAEYQNEIRKIEELDVLMEPQNMADTVQIHETPLLQ